MDNLFADGKARPFLIVMANSYVPGATGPSREPAGAGTTNTTPAVATNAVPGSGRGLGGRMFDFSAFTRVLLEDLISFIDANSRTLNDQPNRAMAGLPMGGVQTRRSHSPTSTSSRTSASSAAAASPCRTSPMSWPSRKK
jgi:enterochelin esterase-like enzyme